MGDTTAIGIILWLCLAVVWWCKRDRSPPPPPEPPEVTWLRTCQAIAQARGDWQMADLYRDAANRRASRRQKG